MKQFFKMFFASLLAMIVAGVVIFGLLIGLIVSAVSSSISEKNEVVVTDKSVLLFDMNQRIHEQGEKNQFAMFSDENTYLPGLYDIVKSIEYAKEDDNVEGIVLKLSNTPNGWATLQQLRVALKDFKTSGKFIYAYGEIIPQNAYYVASVADSVFLNPVGGMELKGFATVLAFFKGTLDKLEVEPEIFYAGKFKSATEPFRKTEMSDENRQQIMAFQEDFWVQFSEAVGERLGNNVDKVNELAKSGAIEFPKDALENNLVDGLWYSDQVNDLLRKRLGVDSDDDIKLVSVNSYADKVRKKNSRKDDRIAVLYAEGSIVDGEANDVYQIASKNMVQTIREIRKNDKVKAVVLRVNSPGGSALASEVILRELQLLQKDKKLIVSMGDVAASGGYYISSHADSIFVMPNTVTGSIGVFAMLFNTQKLMNNKLGITFDEVKNAPYADFPSGIRPMKPDEEQKIQRSIDNIYNTFKTHVAKGRRMTMEQVDEIAQGRVWSGTDAVANGLADGYGDLDRAIASAAKMANIDDYSIQTYPEPIDRLETLLKQMGSSQEAAAKVIAEGVKNEITEEFKWLKQVKAIRDMNGRNMMLMPFEMNTY